MSEKKEFRISSQDAARPAATIHDEARYFAQGLKPEVNVEVETTVGVDADGNAIRRTVYNTGMVRDTFISEESPEAKGAKPFPKPTAKKAKE